VARAHARDGACDGTLLRLRWSINAPALEH